MLRPWRDIGVPCLVFLVLTIPLALSWTLISGAYGRAFAEPVARILLRASPDVVWIDHEDGEPVIALESGPRKRVPRIVEVVPGYSYAVFVALILTGFASRHVRPSLAGRHGLLRIVVGAVAMLVFNLGITILLASYAAAAESRGTIPRGLRLAGAFADVMLMFGPFVIFGLMAVRRQR